MTVFLTGLICLIIGGIGGFGVGFLCYRNNKARIEDIEKTVKG